MKQAWVCSHCPGCEQGGWNLDPSVFNYAELTGSPQSPAMDKHFGVKWPPCHPCPKRVGSMMSGPTSQMTASCFLHAPLLSRAPAPGVPPFTRKTVLCPAAWCSTWALRRREPLPKRSFWELLSTLQPPAPLWPFSLTRTRSSLLQ